MIRVQIVDGFGDGTPVKVSPQGEILTRQLKFGTTKFQEMNVADTAFNFFPPIAGQRFIITNVLLNTNKDVGVNGAIVDIYEASSATSLTIDTQLTMLNILKSDTVPISGLFLAVTEGKFVNGKTDDTIVNATINGYYIDV